MIKTYSSKKLGAVINKASENLSQVKMKEICSPPSLGFDTQNLETKEWESLAINSTSKYNRVVESFHTISGNKRHEKWALE